MDGANLLNQLMPVNLCSTLVARVSQAGKKTSTTI
jgi:hypothetical protein